MSLTTGLNNALTKCDSCPACADSAELAYGQGWVLRDGLWACLACVVREDNQVSCDTCDAVSPSVDHAEADGWRGHDESGTWQCDKCETKERAEMEAEYAHYRRAVRDANDARREGDHERARAIAYAYAGARDHGHD